MLKESFFGKYLFSYLKYLFCVCVYILRDDAVQININKY